MHELWYAGNPSKKIPPYRDIDPKWLAQKQRKDVTHALKVVETINSNLPCSLAEYLKSTDQDALYQQAVQKICKALVADYGHPAKEEGLVRKFAVNTYGSVYENDFVYIRNARSH